MCRWSLPVPCCWAYRQRIAQGHSLFPLPVAARAGYPPAPMIPQGEGVHVDGHSEKVSFIWSVADLLRGDYKASDYGKVILPFTVLRRLDCLLEPTKRAVLAQAAKLPAEAGAAMRGMMLNRVRVISSRWRSAKAVFSCRRRGDPDRPDLPRSDRGRHP